MRESEAGSSYVVDWSLVQVQRKQQAQSSPVLSVF